ncbi:MAG TPA: protein phosphatase 2C domain-containing protein [Arenicellales bacterium]|nr:protein phosphatase 2C domain-containing protein [Arenicellales bacterium]
MEYGISHHTLPGTRSTNQDRAAYAERDNAVLMVVADGLGGYAAGDMAAQIVVDTMIGSFEKVRSASIQDPAAFLVLSISLAHSRINRRARQKGINVSHPRTTCVACLVQDGYAYWAHVGDSRLYHFRDGRFLTRTIDHSTTDPMYQEGILGEKESMQESGHLVRCVGGPKRPMVTLGAETRLENGDVLLLCTDGVWRAFTEREFEQYLDGERLEDSIERMMARSARKFRRDCDNMTVVGLTWNDPATTAPPLMALSVPELDQDALWKDAKQRSAARREDRKRELEEPEKPGVPGADEIEATIAEIESFVDDMEHIL